MGPAESRHLACSCIVNRVYPLGVYLIVETKAWENYAFLGLSEGSIIRIVVLFDTLVARVVIRRPLVNKKSA